MQHSVVALNDEIVEPKIDDRSVLQRRVTLEMTLIRKTLGYFRYEGRCTDEVQLSLEYVHTSAKL